MNWEIQGDCILLHFPLLCFVYIVFFTNWNFVTALCQVSLLVPFSKTICSLHVSVTYFVNSPNISNFFIIIIFVMVICDQRSLIYCKKIKTCWRLRWWLAFFSNKVFFKLRCVHCLRYNVTVYLIDCSMS